MKKAVIDIGTNSCRLFIAEIEKVEDKIKIKEKLLKEMEITRLGEGVDKTRTLKVEAIERTVDTLKRYKNKIDEYKIDIKEVKVNATSATRDSKNREDFITRVRKETGLRIECITGEEEGTLSFSGAISEFNERIIVFDIGGGSTEFILGTKDSIEYVESFNVGAVRLNESFFKGNHRLKEGKVWVENLLGSLKKYRNEEFKMVGVAGTVTTHVSMLLDMEVYDTDKVHMFKLKISDIKNNLDRILKLNVDERKKVKGLHPKRAEVIIPGTYLLIWIMEILGKDEITVCESDILEGMMVYGRN